MKRLILRLLRVFSLVPLAHLTHTEERLGEAEERARDQRKKIERLSQSVAAEQARIETVRADALAATTALKEAIEARQVEHGRATTLLKRERDDARADAEQWKTRARETHDTLRQVKAKIAAAERAEAQLHDTLMATEVKLDLIEAAVNVLDQRTRHSLAP
jgi:chromosome segregation ATPase